MAVKGLRTLSEDEKAPLTRRVNLPPVVLYCNLKDFRDYVGQQNTRTIYIHCNLPVKRKLISQ